MLNAFLHIQYKTCLYWPVERDHHHQVMTALLYLITVIALTTPPPAVPTGELLQVTGLHMAARDNFFHNVHLCLLLVSSFIILPLDTND